jgi:hypothetical protein
MGLTDEEMVVFEAILGELSEVNRKLDLILSGANRLEAVTDNIKEGVGSIAKKVVFG